MKTLTVDRKYAFEQHEACRQGYIVELALSKEAFDRGDGAEFVYRLLRCNGAVAQGFVWAEICAIEPAGWVSRMHDITKLQEQAAMVGHAHRLFAHDLVMALMTGVR